MESLSLRIGEQLVRVRVPAEHRHRYERVAEQVNQLLAEISRQGVVTGPKALAMAAFQIAMDLEESRQALSQTEQSRDRLNELVRRIDQASGQAAGD